MLHREDEADGESRYLMLETIREFAEDQLVASGDAATVHERHATFFLAYADEAEPKMRMGQCANNAESKLRMGTQLTW